MISLSVLITLVYIALGACGFTIVMLLAMVILDYKRGKLW